MVTRNMIKDMLRYTLGMLPRHKADTPCSETIRETLLIAEPVSALDGSDTLAMCLVYERNLRRSSGAKKVRATAEVVE